MRRRTLRTQGILLAVLFVGLAVLFLCAWRSFESEEEPEPKAGREGIIVCIDAGHGGKDCGAQSKERLEKDDNLWLALAVREACEKQGLTVIMTREDDTYLTLQERCDVANGQNADLFVSIHRNSAGNTDSCGVEIWTASKGRGADMADCILQNLKDVGIQQDRGVQSGTSDSGENKDYYVNKHTTMPACLVELGFITNEEDNRLLDAHLQEYAQAIADGIVQAADGLQ